jgi:hypothetical protein
MVQSAGCRETGEGLLTAWPRNAGLGDDLPKMPVLLSKSVAIDVIEAAKRPVRRGLI